MALFNDVLNGLFGKQAVEEPDRIHIPITAGPEPIRLAELYGWRAGEFRVLASQVVTDHAVKTSYSAADIANWIDTELNGWHTELYVHAVPRHGDARKGLGTLKTAAEFIDATDKGVEEGACNKYA